MSSKQIKRQAGGGNGVQRCSSVVLFGLLMLAGLSGCYDKSNKVVEVNVSPASPAERVVSLAIWANYLSPEMQEKFTRETGIKLRISSYSSNEELLAKMQTGAGGIDVAVPSDYMVDVMIKQGLLEPLDKSKLKSVAGLDPQFLKQEYDPSNQYSLPYSWLTTGIAIHRELYKGKISSWKELFENKEISGRLSLLDDAREVMAAAFKVQGLSVNTVSNAELKKAKELILKLKPRVKMFRSDVIDILLGKEVAVAQAYSPDALQAAAKSGGKIEYILPSDGGSRSIDNLVIIKGAKHTDEAHRLIDFLLSKEVDAAFVRAIRGGPVVTMAKDLLDPELKSSKGLFPPAEALLKFERIRDVGGATSAFDRIWTEIKSE